MGRNIARVSEADFVAVRCTLKFWAERSGEPEHFPLTRPTKRNSIGAGELATGQINGLGSIHDGGNDIRCEPRDTNQLPQVPLIEVCKHRIVLAWK